MSSIRKPRHTPQEYLALERPADFKSELINGTIYAMWMDWNTIMFSKSSDTGLTWAPQVQLSGNQWADHPWFGIGYGQWVERSPIKLPVFDAKQGKPVMMGGSVHNRYLLIAVESGIATVVAYLLFVAALLSAAVRRRRLCGNRQLRYLLDALIASTAALLVAGLFIPGSLWEWTLFGSLAAACRLDTASSAARPDALVPAE